MQRKRRLVALALMICLAASATIFTAVQQDRQIDRPNTVDGSGQQGSTTTSPAISALASLPVKGRAPQTGYTRQQFGDGWEEVGGCNVRDHILARDMTNVRLKSATDCSVESGTLNDPYTGKIIQFVRGPNTSSKVQIDHVVALGDAWQTGAQQLSTNERKQLANDPLELLAVDGAANNAKSDGDAATWLPPNKPYRCQYVARQIAVKHKYDLWITQAEHNAMAAVLSNCPDQKLPIVTTL